MKQEDILLFYQHARLGDGDWRNSTKKEFSRAVGIKVPMDTIMCNDIANDVVFFVVDRRNWIDPVKRGL